MWGKHSANRRDQKWGLWVPPCRGDLSQQLAINIPARSEFPIGTLNQVASQLPNYIYIRLQYSMFRHEWKELDLDGFRVAFTGISAERVNALPWSPWHFRLNWTNASMPFSVTVCNKAQGVPQLPPAALDINHPGVWLTDIFLV